jgi:hypothetical protein
MPLTVAISQRALRRIVSWPLPSTEVHTEVLLRLREQLRSDPKSLMVPSSEPRGGMLYPFEFVDPRSRFVVHRFASRVYYRQDEEGLFVADGVYRLSSGE